MKNLKSVIACLTIIFFSSCTKDHFSPPLSPHQSQQVITVPNGSFENWDSMFIPANWITNSCPVCLSPFMTDIIQRDTNACSGTFSAKFIYNGIYPAWAENKFPVSVHPADLTACIKCNLNGADTILIRIRILSNSSVVDSGLWNGTFSIGNYSQITIPITQNSLQADSAIIFIRGGQGIGFPSNSTELWVDNLYLQ
jgi:hypothetical protein